MSMSTTLPFRSAGVRGRELSHSPPIPSEGSLPSIGSGTEDVKGFMGLLQSFGVWAEARTGPAIVAARNKRMAFKTSRVAMGITRPV
jgi:hypothetical protein